MWIFLELFDGIQVGGLSSYLVSLSTLSNDFSQCQIFSSALGALVVVTMGTNQFTDILMVYTVFPQSNMVMIMKGTKHATYFVENIRCKCKIAQIIDINIFMENPECNYFSFPNWSKKSLSIIFFSTNTCNVVAMMCYTDTQSIFASMLLYLMRDIHIMAGLWLCIKYQRQAADGATGQVFW